MPDIKKIVYGGRTLDLPAGMTLEEAKAQMARFFPELSEPKIETKKDGDVTTYTFSKQAGRKGVYKEYSAQVLIAMNGRNLTQLAISGVPKACFDKLPGVFHSDGVITFKQFGKLIRFYLECA